MQIFDPLEFFFRMGIWMLTVWPMRLRRQGIFRAVVQLVSAHQRRLGYVVPSADKADILRLAVQFHGLHFC